MSKRKDQIRERIKARAAEAVMSAESSAPKRVVKAIKLCGGRASVSRVLDTVNKDRGRILSYNEVKGILEEPSLFKKMPSSTGGFIYQLIDPPQTGIPVRRNESKTQNHPIHPWVTLDSRLNSKRKYVKNNFEAIVRYEVGFVMTRLYGIVFLWDEDGKIRYRIECLKTPDSQKYYYAKRVFDRLKDDIAEKVEQGFNDLSYQELQLILHDTRAGGTSNLDMKNLRRLVSARNEETLKRRAPVKKHDGAVGALEALGGYACLHDISRMQFGREVSEDDINKTRAELDAANHVGGGRGVYRLYEGYEDNFKVSEPEQGRIVDKKAGPHARIAPGEKVLVVKRDTFSCLSKGHVIESLLVDIPIASVKGVRYKTVEIQHCTTEDKFFIFETDFKEALYGKVRKEDVLKTFVFEGKNWGLLYSTNLGWADKSPLNLAGYNVNQQDNLSEGVRRKILVDIIELGVLDPATVKSYLSWYISNHGKQDKNWLAVKKWRSDLTFIQNKYTTNHIGRWVGKIRT